MPSLSTLLGVGAATFFSVASATKYAPVDTLPGSSFFDHFDFVTEEKTNGFVKYVDRNTAEQKQYISYEDGDAVFGVDHTSMLNSADGGDIGRESVRLEGKKDYNKGLFVLDIKHMPGGICGTWPAFWALGREPWPVKGEIDIVEGVNTNSLNTVTLHTDTQCKVNGLGQTGKLAAADCALDSAGTTGCDVGDSRTTSYGVGFNANSGGHYVTEWQDDGIKIWFFPRGSAPNSLATSEPDTTEFGTPVASFQGDCDMEKRFMDQRFIFTNTFCGDWAGIVYEQSGCPMYDGLSGMASCKKYVAEHPALYKEAYWRVSSFKTYNERAVVSSSSLAPSSTPHVSSSSTQVSSSSVHASISSAYPISSPVAASGSSTAVSSSSVQVFSTSVSASSSSAVSSSSVLSSSVTRSSATRAPAVLSSASPSPSSSVAVSSSVSNDPSSTVSASALASETLYPSSFSSSASGFSPSALTSSVSESPHSRDGPMTISRSSASNTPHVSSIVSLTSEVSSAATSSASESPYSRNASSRTSSTSASSTPSSSDVSATSSYRVASGTSSTLAAVSYEGQSVSPSETLSASSVISSSEDPYSSTAIYSSGTSGSAHPAASAVSSSSASVHSAPAPVTSGLSSSTPLPSADPAEEKTTTAYETTYIDVGPAGYTTVTATVTATITTKVSATQTTAAHSTTDAHYAPPGFQVTTKYCAQGCGAGPTAVTVTVPYASLASSHGGPGRPTDRPGRPYGPDNTHYSPSQHGPPSASDNAHHGQPGSPSSPENNAPYNPNQHGEPSTPDDTPRHTPGQPDFRGKPSTPDNNTPDDAHHHRSHASQRAKPSPDAARPGQPGTRLPPAHPRRHLLAVVAPALNATASHSQAALSTGSSASSGPTMGAATPAAVSASAASLLRVESLLVAWSVSLVVASVVLLLVVDVA